MSFNIHHMRVLMKCTLAWTAIVTIVLAYLFHFHGEDYENYWPPSRVFRVLPVRVFWLIALALLVWWTARVAWVFRASGANVFALVWSGMNLGVFVFFVGLFSFRIVEMLPFNQTFALDWQWPVPAVFSGAMIGLLAGAVEAIALLAEDHAKTRSVVKDTLEGAAIGGFIPALLCSGGTVGGLIGSALTGFFVVGAFCALSSASTEAPFPGGDESAFAHDCAATDYGPRTTD